MPIYVYAWDYQYAHICICLGLSVCPYMYIPGIIEQSKLNGRIEGGGEIVAPTVQNGDHFLILDKVQVVDVTRRDDKPAWEETS